MAAFHLENEQQRLREPGVTNGLGSMQGQLASLLAERTDSLNGFTLFASLNAQAVTAPGFEHRGDLAEGSYSRSVDTAESEAVARRFALENTGYKKAQALFFDVPLHSTIVLFSPPPAVEIKGYAGESMVYFYHLLPGESEDKRVVKSLALKTRFSPEEQARFLGEFFGSEVEPSEAGILLSPLAEIALTEDTKSFRRVWQALGDLYEERTRDFLWPPVTVAEDFLLNGQSASARRFPNTAAIINEVAGMIVRGEAGPELERAWRVMLNIADAEMAGLHQDLTANIPAKDRGVLFAQFDFAPRVVATSCGNSGGLGSSSLIRSEATLTTQTSEVSRTDSEPFECPNCHAKTYGPVGNQCPHCKITKDEAAEKGLITC